VTPPHPRPPRFHLLIRLDEGLLEEFGWGGLKTSERKQVLMKTAPLGLPMLPWLLAALVAGIQAPGTFKLSAQQSGSDSPPGLSSAQPFISSIRIDAEGVIVAVQIPAGFKKVTLETRSRLESGSWMPRLVSRSEGEAREWIVRLPFSSEMELVRVRAVTEDMLPAFFYEGESSFAGEPGTGNAPPGGVFTNDSFDRTESGGAGREVVESDIWRMHGDTLYFFNQFRGLQIIDLSETDAPVLAGTLALPAAGEQMYVLDDDHVVLLARDGCGWGIDGPAGQVLVVGVSDHHPVVQAVLPIPGHIQESRLVGSALYVAAQSYRSAIRTNDAGTGTIQVWEWGTRVLSFDLSDPANPASRDQLWFPGWGNTVMATDRFLFVASRDTGAWWRSVVQMVDISAPDGAMTALGSITPAGFVQDKFKMHVKDDVFTVISQAWNETRRWVTSLETFSLGNAARPQRLGRLELAEGEQLHATRFDGDRVYIVTYFIIDPLWVVDLSNPAAPRIAGELEVPGWSTYIHPLGDHLVAIGIDDTEGWRVAVSLFDVSDPAQPSLADKVLLGENHSWSEANRDEKAFNVMPEHGLILVPYQGDSVDGYAQRVQLIDLELSSDASLKVRGAIDHAMQPRRATVHRDRILSISGKELLGVDATDRDAPVARSQTELSWAAHRLFVLEDHLIQLDQGATWGGPVQPFLRIARTDAPDEILARFELESEWPVIGAALEGEYLYVAQAPSGNGWTTVRLEDGTYETVHDTNSVFQLSVISFANLPEVTLAGRIETPALPLGWNPSLKALWPQPGVLVWSAGMGGIWWWNDIWLREAGGVADGLAAQSFVSPRFWGGQTGRLLAFDVANPEQPEFMSEVDLAKDSNWWSFSEAYTADGLVFLSHQRSEFLERQKIPDEELPPPAVDDDDSEKSVPPGQTADDGSGATPEIQQSGIWTQRHYLDVIDYSDPRDPVIRPSVNLPGALKGLSHDGALLYTIGQRWDEQTWTTDWTEWLSAAAYDGVEVFLVDRLELPRYWPRPVLIAGSRTGHLFIGRAGDTSADNSSPSQLESWVLANDGKFTRLGTVSLDQPARELAMFNSLLAAQTSDEVMLYDATIPDGLKRIGAGLPDGCLWLDLSHAAGSVSRGLWLPLGDYGTFHISVADAE
jgi:hypothetical protein